MDKINILYETILSSQDALTAASLIDEKYNGEKLDYNKLLEVFKKDNQINYQLKNIMIENDSSYLFLEVLIYLIKNNYKAVFYINKNYGVNNYLKVIANTIYGEEIYTLVHGDITSFITNNDLVYAFGTPNYLMQFNQYKNIIKVNLN